MSTLAYLLGSNQLSFSLVSLNPVWDFGFNPYMVWYGIGLYTRPD